MQQQSKCSLTNTSAIKCRPLKECPIDPARITNQGEATVKQPALTYRHCLQTSTSTPARLALIQSRRVTCCGSPKRDFKPICPKAGLLCEFDVNRRSCLTISCYSEDDKGRIFYYSESLRTSTWEHPADSQYRSLSERERSKSSKSLSNMTSLANIHFFDDEFSLKSNEAKGQSEDQVESVAFDDIQSESVHSLHTDSEDKTLDITDDSKDDKKEIFTVKLTAGDVKPREVLKGTPKVELERPKSARGSKYVVAEPEEVEVEEVDEPEVEVEEPEDENESVEQEEEEEEEDEVDDVHEIMAELEDKFDGKCDDLQEQIKELDKKVDTIKQQLGKQQSSQQQFKPSTDQVRAVEQRVAELQQMFEKFKHTKSQDVQFDGSKFVSKDGMIEFESKMASDINSLQLKIEQRLRNLEQRQSTSGHDIDTSRFCSRDDLRKLESKLQQEQGDNNETINKSLAKFRQELRTDLNECADKANESEKTSRAMKKDIQALTSGHIDLDRKFEQFDERCKSLERELRSVRSDLQNKPFNSQDSQVTRELQSRVDQLERSSKQDSSKLLDMIEQVSKKSQEFDAATNSKVDRVKVDMDELMRKVDAVCEKVLSEQSGLKDLDDKIEKKIEYVLEQKAKNVHNSLDARKVTLEQIDKLRAELDALQSFIGQNDFDYDIYPHRLTPNLWPHNAHVLRPSRRQTQSLLDRIHRNQNLLQTEANVLERMGNYQFASNVDYEPVFGFRSREERDHDMMKRVQMLRVDVHEKLGKLNEMITGFS